VIGMKKLVLTTIVLLSISSPAFAALGFLKGERISGMNKICYYNVLGSTYTLNVGLSDMCPVSYEF